MGVEILCNAIVGKLFTIDELVEEEGFDAVFVVPAPVSLAYRSSGEN